MVDAIALEILWGRLTSIVDEAATNMIRTAFSTLVREMNDFAVVLTDATGNSIVQNTITIPVFIGTVPKTVKHILQTHPAPTWHPGDVLITNDPYLGTGHQNDITTITPVFAHGQLVAFMGNVAHSSDIGGVIMGRACRDNFEEGLRIPPLKLYQAGKPNETLFEMIADNVRVPVEVLGDIAAQVVGNETGSRRLAALMDELGLTEIGTAAAIMADRSEQAMREVIRSLPDGVYRYDEVREDGLYEPLRFNVAVEIRGDEILVDYAGTTRQQRYGVNSVLNYTYAYTAYPLKCILIPELPNNEGCFRPISVTAPPGCLLNPIPPAPLSGRALTGHVLQACVFGALQWVLPDRVLADSGTPNMNAVMMGEDQHGRRFSSVTMNCGGMGAHRDADGQSTTAFPSNTGNTPIEVIETLAPLQILERELIPDSGGPGTYRGGLGQRVRYQVLGEKPVTVSLNVERLTCPPLGVAGGLAGRSSQVRIEPARPIDLKSLITLNPGEVLIFDTAGGGGHGDPADRSPEAIARDLKEGYITTWPGLR